MTVKISDVQIHRTAYMIHRLIEELDILDSLPEQLAQIFENQVGNKNREMIYTILTLSNASGVREQVVACIEKHCRHHGREVRSLLTRYDKIAVEELEKEMQGGEVLDINEANEVLAKFMEK